jgi:hypothetical protein
LELFVISTTSSLKILTMFNAEKYHWILCRLLHTPFGWCDAHMDCTQYLVEVVWCSDVDKKNLAWGKNLTMFNAEKYHWILCRPGPLPPPLEYTGRKNIDLHVPKNEGKVCTDINIK